MARVLTPILVLLNLGLIAFLVIRGADAGGFVFAAISLGSALFLFARTRRPMHTWPAWLFTVKR